MRRSGTPPSKGKSFGAHFFNTPGLSHKVSSEIMTNEPKSPRPLESFLESRPSEPALKEWMDKLPPEEDVECALYLSRLGGTTFVRVYSLEHAYKNADKLSDEELFFELARALNDSVQMTDKGIGLVNPKD